MRHGSASNQSRKAYDVARFVDALRDLAVTPHIPVDGCVSKFGKRRLTRIDRRTMRWKIEVFHKILKSGCRAEQARLRTAERLVRLLAVFCILSWRVFWLTMLNRAEPDLEPALVLTDMETTMLDRLIPDPAHDLPAPRTLSLYLTKIAVDTAAISPAPKTRRRETSSCGAASPV